MTSDSAPERDQGDSVSGGYPGPKLANRNIHPRPLARNAIFEPSRTPTRNVLRTVPRRYPNAQDNPIRIRGGRVAAAFLVSLYGWIGRDEKRVAHHPLKGSRICRLLQLSSLSALSEFSFGSPTPGLIMQFASKSQNGSAFYNTATTDPVTESKIYVIHACCHSAHSLAPGAGDFLHHRRLHSPSPRDCYRHDLAPSHLRAKSLVRRESQTRLNFENNQTIY